MTNAPAPVAATSATPSIHEEKTLTRPVIAAVRSSKRLTIIRFHALSGK
jgi:hypothetical protein